MSTSLRLWLAAGSSLLVGGFMGAYATRALYGSEPSLRPSPTECAPCPDCPSCPVPEPCGNVSPAEALADRARWAPESEEPELALPGLGPTAIAKAQELLRKAAAPCMQRTSEADGVLVFSFTVTSSVGTARVTKVEVTDRRGLDEGSEVELCIIDEAVAVSFDWAEDGQGTMLMPLPIEAQSAGSR